MPKVTRPTDRYKRNNNIPKANSVERLQATRLRLSKTRPTLGKLWQSKMLAYYDRLIAEAKERDKRKAKLALQRKPKPVVVSKLK